MSVIVFGSMNLDIALRLPARMAWGQTLLADNSAEAVGGKGLNQAIAAARFGAKVTMAGAVGDDAPGRTLRAALDTDGIRTSTLEQLSGVPSGRATILIEPSGENMIAVEPGANMHASAQAALSAITPETRILLCQLETDIGEMEALFSHPSAKSLRKILNAAPAIQAGSALFALADMLIFNQSEFAEFLQVDAEPRTLDDLLIARRLLIRPDQAVVVTLGASGSAAIMQDRTLFAAPLPAERVIDTSGAGDCFCGVLAACLDQGIDLEPALRFANAAASLAVERAGAAPSMPMRQDVDKRLKAG